MKTGRKLPTRKKVIREILTKYEDIWAISYGQMLMGWDKEVYMPPKAAPLRGLAAARLSLLSRRMLLDPAFVSLVEKAEKREDLNDVERGIVRVLRRSIDKLTKIPENLIYELQMTTTQAAVAWRTAKEKSDFQIFKPYLAKIVNIQKQIADHLGWEGHPLDALLDWYEEGLTVADLEKLFPPLEKGLKQVLDKVMADGRFPQKHPLEDARYKKGNLEKVNKRVLDLLGYPWERARIDVSPHPFTTGMPPYDLRITTRYEGFDFKRSLLAVIHEFGHALYELGLDPRLAATPVAGGVSLGVHESQSRFWENQVGRRKEFVELIYPTLKRHLRFITQYRPEDVYVYFNTVRPSLIRTEADEVTYNFHIILRYRIEKGLIEGSLKVDDLEEIWNSYMEEILGVKPRNAAEGVLQDIHWSMGSIGYFPTYSIGTILASQIAEKIRQDLPFEELVAKGRFAPIRRWLRDKIHKYGSIYPPKELLARSLGIELDSTAYIRYLEAKYLS